MSDFLSRLIGRSRGDLAVARPVIPPLFAPEPQVGAGDEVTAGADGPDGVADGARPPVLRPETPTRAPAAAAGPEFEADPRASPRAASAPRIPAPVGPPRPMWAAPPQAAEADAPWGGVPRETAAPEEAPPSVRGERSARQAPATAERPAPTVHEGPRPRRLAPAPPTETDADNAAPGRTLPRLPARVLLPPEAARERRALPGPRTEAAGVVVVKIGRIEVRATPPAPAVTPAPPKRTAAVALQDYLRPKRRER